MLVEPGSPLVGRTIEEAGLRGLDGLFLMEIDRGGHVMAAVPPTERLEMGDRLVFVGVVDSVVELQKIRGLRPATDQVFQLDGPRSERVLLEAVVSNTCPLVGQTIRAGRFRSTYDAVVIAVARNGERLQMKIGDIVLEPGDTLLLEASPSFLERQRSNRDFYLVSEVSGSTPPRHDQAWIACTVLAAMVLAATFELVPMVAAAFAARRGLPVAALRAVADTDEETLPKAALVGLTPDGRPAPLRVLLALARKPGDLKPLRVVAARSRTALEALGHGVHLLRGNLQRA
jgi:Trk K+ transport system NAD-binding subunit